MCSSKKGKSLWLPHGDGQLHPFHCTTKVIECGYCMCWVHTVLGESCECVWMDVCVMPCLETQYPKKEGLDKCHIWYIDMLVYYTEYQNPTYFVGNDRSFGFNEMQTLKLCKHTISRREGQALRSIDMSILLIYRVLNSITILLILIFYSHWYR